ncbi:hypothetical protein MXD63_17580 [Frankia sp. Cpl3]|nr:hypothetical protein [Frankia sp. Cpl3]
MDWPWFETPTDRVRELLGSDIMLHLERALGITQRDADATFPQLGELRLRWVSDDADDPDAEGDDPYVIVYVALSTSGSYYSGGSSAYAGGSDDEEAVEVTFEDIVASVADCTQDLVLSLYLREWPVCPQHNRSLGLSFPEDWPTWSCQVNGGHGVAKVGSLADINEVP